MTQLLSLNPTSEELPENAADIFAELTLEAKSGRGGGNPEAGRQATLARLKEACDALEVRRVAIRSTAVEEYIKQKYGKETGPRAQSISNEKGRRLGMWHYLQARQREQKGLRLRNPRKDLTKVIDEIEDSYRRDRLRSMQAESELNARKLQRAQSLFAKIAPGVDFSRLLSTWKLSDDAIALPAQGLPNVDVKHLKALKEAITSLTDANVLDRCGLRYDGKRVERKGGTGDVLLGLGVLVELISLYDVLTKSEPTDLDSANAT